MAIQKGKVIWISASDNIDTATAVFTNHTDAGLAGLNDYGDGEVNDNGPWMEPSMAVGTNELMQFQGPETGTLAAAVARYQARRRALEILLECIDDEVTRLVGRRPIGCGERETPAHLVDLDVCPSSTAGRLTLNAALPVPYKPQHGNNRIDETVTYVMSKAINEGSAEADERGARGSTAGSCASASDAHDCIASEAGLDSSFLIPGSVLGERFELIKCVGTGGSSAVYKALDRRRLEFDDISPYVALKVLKPRFSASPDWLESLKREASTSQLLVHPNIIRVYDALRDGSVVYIVMEYLSGVPLTHKIRSEEIVVLPRDLALKIIESMGRALAFAHKRGIVHCDFKPANVFLAQDGSIKLIDFGIAQLLSPPDPLNAGGEQLLAHPRDMHPVTPAYASPELLDRQNPDPRDDVYSLACTAYELLTGTHPFEFRSAIEARKMNLAVERREGLSKQQWKALVRALALTREERTPTVAKFLSDLNGWSWQAQILSKAAGTALMNSGLNWLAGARSTDSETTASEQLPQPTPRPVLALLNQPSKALSEDATSAKCTDKVSNSPVNPALPASPSD